MSQVGPSATSIDVCSCAAVEGIADVDVGQGTRADAGRDHATQMPPPLTTVRRWRDAADFREDCEPK
jgi:hypothetical protein